MDEFTDVCPYCGEYTTVRVDCFDGATEGYLDDVECDVCQKKISVYFALDCQYTAEFFTVEQQEKDEAKEKISSLEAKIRTLEVLLTQAQKDRVKDCSD